MSKQIERIHESIDSRSFSAIPSPFHPPCQVTVLRTKPHATPLRDPVPAPTPQAGGPRIDGRSIWRESLDLMEKHLAFVRRKVDTETRLYLCGANFDMLYLVSSGMFKSVNLVPDGREQPAGLHFRGDWLGFDGICTGRHECSAVALDAGEVWGVRYDSLLQASSRVPKLMHVVFAAMSAQMTRHRDAILCMSTLPADARVADFLLRWTNALAERGLRTDQITIHMTRADMGKHLGLTLESVSRALSRLARCGVIRFSEKGRRDIAIPQLAALSAFIQTITDRPATAIQ